MALGSLPEAASKTFGRLLALIGASWELVLARRRPKSPNWFPSGLSGLWRLFAVRGPAPLEGLQ
eukprot:15236080-Alexandrium_andersonii.AAC.1